MKMNKSSFRNHFKSLEWKMFCKYLAMPLLINRALADRINSILGKCLV